MGLRFRKSIKIAPGVKINLNKNSISATVGTRGAHYTVNSKGKKTTTVGVPGTGLSYTSSTGGNKYSKSNSDTSSGINDSDIGAHSSKKNKRKGCLTVFIVLFILGGICSLFTNDNKPTDIKISADTKTVYDINSDIPVKVECEPSSTDLNNITCESDGGSFTNENGVFSFKADKDGIYKVYVKCGDIKSNSLTFNIEDKEAKRKAEEEAKKQAELEEQKKAEEEAAAQAAAESQAQQQDQSQAQQPQEEMVWISNTGSKYHSNSSCSGMDNPSQVPISQAQSMGLQPCKKCH